jgi:hypothetical protein
MRKTAAMLLSVATLLCATVVHAHDVTYEGTIVAVEPNPYVASDGIEARLEVKVADRERTMIFDIMQWKTEVFRGDRMVSFVAARMQQGETVAVTINHDEPEQGTLEVRLQSRE